MNKCDICGKEFELHAHDRYTVIDVNPTNLFIDLKRPVTYNAFDCPYCGCQNRRGTLLPSCSSTPKKILFKSHESEEEDANDE